MLFWFTKFVTISIDICFKINCFCGLKGINKVGEKLHAISVLRQAGWCASIDNFVHIWGAVLRIVCSAKNPTRTPNSQTITSIISTPSSITLWRARPGRCTLLLSHASQHLIGGNGYATISARVLLAGIGQAAFVAYIHRNKRLCWWVGWMGWQKISFRRCSGLWCYDWVRWCGGFTLEKHTPISKFTGNPTTVEWAYSLFACCWPLFSGCMRWSRVTGLPATRFQINHHFAHL